jgi:hypothetical protein
MRRHVAVMLVPVILCLAGCGEVKKKAGTAASSVEDAAAAKAKKIENFAKERINVDTQSP